MAAIRPFSGYFVNPERAVQVVSPAYDSLTPSERHEYAQSHPGNYLNTMRSLDEFPPGQQPTLDELMQRNSAAVQELIASGSFLKQSRECLYLYRLAVDGHEQTGVVAQLPIDEYDQGKIKRHEHTQSDKEDDLTEYNDVVGASSSPICLAYKRVESIDRLVADAAQADPVLVYQSDDGVVHTIWCIEDAASQAELASQFARVESTYLTDGHHRAASGLRFAAKRRSLDPNYTGDESGI